MSFVKDKRTFIAAALLGGVVVVLLVVGWPKPAISPGYTKTLESISTSTSSSRVVNNIQYNTIPVTVGSKVFIADIADTEALHELGLSGRSTLGSEEAMLFVFPFPGRYSFWMKDMNFPIDMIWLDQDGTVVSIAARATPQSFPKSFTPTADSTFVIELPADTVTLQNIKIGDRLIFDKKLLKNTSN